ncbi:MAG: cell division protein FtsZ [Chitinophagaceae bacterium]
MIYFDLPKEKSSIIKVIGVGGGGSNAVNYMYNQRISGVDFIICNTDAQSLAQSQVPNKVQLGPYLTQGLGAGANPEIGRQATEESLEEIRKILEVNTKMAFITAGMGGGTGTGGAPIISKICKDLGILTVGIVTTPFSYEGKKRKQQAEEGISILKKYVDTLLIISNDKLRHQFGNLKMREAFSKADNILATAAKCITDVINSTGQINVDFADVCTVMREGGVAMLGSATARGPQRAQLAIEEALNSPLLNDSDIHGAKWILININSSEGEYEFTMDEVEVIQQHILSLTGEETDVILGLGYDAQLDDEMSITLIASGYEYTDPFSYQEARQKKTVADEKIVMVLDMKKEVPAQQESNKAGVLAQTPRENQAEQQRVAAEPLSGMQALRQDLQPKLIDPDVAEEREAVYFSTQIGDPAAVESTVDKKNTEAREEWVLSLPTLSGNTTGNSDSVRTSLSTQQPSNLTTGAGGYLAKPTNIYAEGNELKSNSETTPVNHSKESTAAPQQPEEEPSEMDLQLIFKEELPAADMPGAYQTPHPVTDIPSSPGTAQQDEEEDLKRRSAERIQKLRNLSFNINAADPNNEFETVPAYIRRNLDLSTPASPAENYYSNYEIRKEEDQTARISTLNTFLDGKKPD